MTDNTKYTKTPWTAHMVNTAMVNIRAGEISVAAVYRHIGSPVLHDRAGEGDGNADFIVRACNSHAALVEALEAMLAAYPAFRSKPVGAPNSDARIKQEEEIRLEDYARAALALARGDT